MSRFACIALSASLMSLAPHAPAWAQEILESQIAAVLENFANQGFQRSPGDRTGSARAGESTTMSFQLQAGVDYVFVGVCDQDCDDLDLVLLGPSGSTIGQDIEVDAYPMVSAEGAQGGNYRLRVDMVNCSIEPCAYMVSVFERGAGGNAAGPGPGTSSGGGSGVVLLSQSGTLSAGDTQLNSGEFVDQYEFEAKAGDNLTVSLSSDAFDTYLILVDPSGNQQDNDDASDGETDSRLQLVATESGTWMLKATSYEAGETGSYMLEVRAGGGSNPAASAPATASATRGEAAAQPTSSSGGATARATGSPGAGGGLGPAGNPGNLSLVGAWRDERDISDDIAMDDQGFFKTGNDEWNYNSVGTYTFDGSTITVRMHRAEGLEYTQGETYRFPVSNVSSGGFNIDKGDYATRYVPDSAYGISEDDRNSVRAIFHHAAIADTWWEGDGQVFLFLSPDFLIIRGNSDSEIRRYHFVGNELRFQMIDADGTVSRFGQVQDWTDDRMSIATSGGTRTLRSGTGNQSLTAEESQLYRNYVVLTQDATMQALLGITQGMGIIDVVWR